SRHLANVTCSSVGPFSLAQPGCGAPRTSTPSADSAQPFGVVTPAGSSFATSSIVANVAVATMACGPAATCVLPTAARFDAAPMAVVSIGRCTSCQPSPPSSAHPATTSAGLEPTPAVAGPVPTA